MKLLREIPSEGIKELFFEMCLKSKSGCNIIVEDKSYNVYINSRGEHVVKEFRPDYELTKEEFKKIFPQ